jgi:hypothetical protein
VVVVLFSVKIYCFDSFKSVQLLFAAAFVELKGQRLKWLQNMTGLTWFRY